MSINYTGSGGGIPRKTAKIFASNADSQDVTVFGSTLAEDTTYTTDIAEIQSSAFETGWRDAVISNLNYPLLSDMNGVQKTLSQQIAYILQHGIPAYDSGTTYYAYDKVLYNDIIYTALQDNFSNHVPSDDTYWAEYYNPNKEALRNIGEIVSSAIPLTDAGLHLLDGSLLSGTGIYAEFVNYIGDLVSTYPDIFCSESDWQTTNSTYGACGKFVYTSASGDNPATVRIPKITNILEGTTDLTALGDLVASGLPQHTHTRGTMNITGTFEASDDNENGTVTTGAFYTYATNGVTATGPFAEKMIAFDASRTWSGSTSNAYYAYTTTDTTKVQPQTIKCLYYIVIASLTKTEIEVDIDEIATDLNGKADTDLTNVNSTGTAKVANWGMPSNIYTNLTVGASGATYTALSDGYYYYESDNLVNTYTFFYLRNETTGFSSYSMASNYVVATGSLGVRKGDVVTFGYFGNSSANIPVFRFYYAEGAKGEA